MKLDRTQCDVLIIGAGAAGLMCAATAGYQGRSVVVIDHAPKAAAKIRISGGGKCNFTNQNVTAENYISRNPHFVKSALSRYPASAFVELVERHGVEYEQRELGKLFCKERASDLIQILRTECDWAGVEIRLKTDVKTVEAVNENGFRVETSQGVIECAKLVGATGGLSFPKLKASGLGYQLATQFGHTIVPTAPGLVPLNFSGRWQQRLSALSGLSLEASVSAGGHTFTEAVLFTHQGLSGPAVLQASNYWQPGEPIVLNLLPGCAVYQELAALKREGQSLKTWLHRFWPRRLVKAWLEWFPQEIPLANLSDEALKALSLKLTELHLYPEETGGYDKAEVTLGGVNTDEISSQTLESKKQPGLFFIGEVMDVTGQLGGYNFQWAWASGVACGLAV